MRGPIGLFFGTRPQVIKASILRQSLSKVGQVLSVDTGQHYDYQLHQVHYDQLGVEPPDDFLGVGSGSHAQQTAAILTATAEWIRGHKPSLAVVIGDTNSTLACALAATQLRVPVAHVEAGLRATDRLMAEDVNRRIVDAIADVLFAPSEASAATLRREHPRATTEFVGDVAYDVLIRALPRAPATDSLAAYTADCAQGFVYVTLHRAELVDDAVLLQRVLEALDSLDRPCIFPVHPRTRKQIESLDLTLGARLHLTTPVGYLESVALTKAASAVVTDSGGLQREAYWLGVPCVTVRGETEWHETITLGANVLVNPRDVSTLGPTINEAVRRRRAGASWDRKTYGAGDAAARIATVLASFPMKP